MENRTQLLEKLGAELKARSIAYEIGMRPQNWTPTPIPTLTTGPYLGHAQVTVDTRGCYRWLDRHGHVRLRPHGDAAEVAVCVIQDRAGTLSPPEPDPQSPTPPAVPAPLPRRGDRRPGDRPMYRPHEAPADPGPPTA